MNDVEGGAVSALRVLVLCTGNSARSQIAEALLTSRGAGRVLAASAGVDPAPRVNPFAEDVLRDAGIDWTGRTPRGMDAVLAAPWDIVISVCDHANEVCPVFPGAPVRVHWGLPDPAHVEPETARRAAFRDTFDVLSARVDALLSLPLSGMDARSREAALKAIAGPP